MTAPLLHDPLPTDVLRQLAESVQAEEPMRRRIVAAIIAVPTGKDFDRS